MSFPITPTRHRLLQILAMISSLLVASQIAYSLFKGSAICLNTGCTIVERLTVVSPLIINILGLLFFQAVFWLSRWRERFSHQSDNLLFFLLLSGLAAEGVLLGYQIFVARALCGYCLTVLVCVLALNLVAGVRHMVSGMAAMGAIVGAFSLLVFLPTQVLPENYSFKLGTFAVCSCESPSKEIFLLFSSDCPHCHTVIQELENCNSCQLNLNPIDKIDALDFPNAKLQPSYSPEINRLMLALFGINQIPVLVVKNPEGYSFIKGEKNILSYVRLACFQQEPVMILESSAGSSQDGISLFSEDDQNCSIDIRCEEQTGESDRLQSPISN